MTQTKRPNYVLWMLCVFMLLSAASYFFRPKEPEISYAEVVQLFEQEKVKSFTVPADIFFRKEQNWRKWSKKHLRRYLM